MADTVPVQPSLFTVVERSGAMYVPDQSLQADEAVVTDVIEQKMHLLNSLGFLAAANSREGFQYVDEAELTRRYGDRAEPVKSSVASKVGELRTKAKISFQFAVGHFALLDAAARNEEFDPRVIKRNTRQMFSDFTIQYGFARRHKANYEYRKQLESEIEELANRTEQEYSELNRLHGHRPHNPRKALATSRDAEELPEKLSSRERVEAILLDPRAGFLPKTNAEKTRTISWLDYLDDPENPLGIIHQLQEVYIRGENPTRKSDRKPSRHLGSEYGVRSIESLAWEVGDSLLEADRRRQALYDLQTAIKEGQRPTLSLFDALAKNSEEDTDKRLESILEDHIFGLIAFVQYTDILEFVKHGREALGGRDPLSGTAYPPQSERPKFDPTPGKRKTVYSQYTRPDRGSSMDEHIIMRLKKLTVKELRHGIGDCIGDVEREYLFLNRRLREIGEFRGGAGRPQAVQNAVAEITRLLENK